MKEIMFPPNQCTVPKTGLNENPAICPEPSSRTPQLSIARLAVLTRQAYCTTPREPKSTQTRSRLTPLGGKYVPIIEKTQGMIDCAKGPPYREDTRNNKLVGLSAPCQYWPYRLTYSRNRRATTLV